MLFQPVRSRKLGFPSQLLGPRMHFHGRDIKHTSTYSHESRFFEEHQEAERTREARMPGSVHITSPCKHAGAPHHNSVREDRASSSLRDQECCRVVARLLGAATGNAPRCPQCTETSMENQDVSGSSGEAPCKVGERISSPCCCLMGREISSPCCSTSPFLIDHSHSDANNKGKQS